MRARIFVNRTGELDRLNDILAADDGVPLAVSVCVIAGTAGAGKTALALRWARQVMGRFPHGQLYINLHGYDPGAPVTSLYALQRFLTALGVPVGAVPSDVEAASALYRSVLADRRMLIVLDNASSVAQVRPLIPGNDHCLSIVTSRGRLSGLAVREGAQRLTLGMLPQEEAVALLHAVTDGYRTDDDEAKLAELARLCARLPLALRIAAERAASQPHMQLDEFMADLRDESALWEALSTGDGDEAEAVRSVFAWSYQGLAPDAARLFRLLGLYPGLDIGIGAVASLAGVSIRRARQLLDTLVGSYLLEQTAPDRFEFHDLLRAFAADQARLEELPDDSAAALLRVLSWLLRTADAAQSWIEPTADHLALDTPDDGVAPLSFLNYDQAVDWSEREQANFLPAVLAAEKNGHGRYAWQLATVLWNAQAPSAQVTDWLAMGKIGLRAARRLGERAQEATLLASLGVAYGRINRQQDSLESHQAGLKIRRELGDRRGEAISLNALGLVHLRRRRFNEAESRFREALSIFQDLDDTRWQAVAHSNLGTLHYQTDRLAESAHFADQALVIHRNQGNTRSVGNALRLQSAIHLEPGERNEALRTAQKAVELALDLRDHVLEGYWLIALGDAQQALGQCGDALVSYERSATLHRRLGDRSREALAWHGTGQTYHRLERDEEAASFHRMAAAAHRELGDAWNQAVALDGLANTLRSDAPDEARRHWTEALRLIAGYPDPRAARMRERIAGQLA
jgi:tetratricopeptide (TPR) repeat protein